MRSTMPTLVGRVRRLVGDPDQAARYFQDDTIQDALDEHRLDVRYFELSARVTYVTSGPVVWLDYYDGAYGGNWEDDLLLTGFNWATLTPATSDTLTGHWTFAASQTPPVWITGKSYDVYAAAAQLVDERAAAVMLDFDVTSDKQSVLRSQKHAMLTARARELRKRMRVSSTRAYRRDSIPQRSGC